jgi:serine/threonine-protein kinase
MMTGKKPERVCVPRNPCNITTSQAVLPAEVTERAVARLGWMALFFVATVHLVHWSRVYLLSPDVLSHINMPSLANLGLIGGTAAGLTVCALAWSRRLPPGLVLDIGMIFEVVAAFSIATLENSTPMPHDGWLRGVSGVALWITFFILVVPGSLGKTALAAISSVLMGPLALLIYASTLRTPVPDPGSFFSMFFPDLLCALWAIILSRFIYGLGRDLGHARRMGYYELIERLGRGGMGEVWRAKHRLLARPAAIKLISPEAAGAGTNGLTSTMIRRFEHEAQATAALRSQHTIQLYDFGVTDDGALYYEL